MAENLTNSIKSRKCRHLIRKPSCTSYFKIQFDELVSFHSISYLSVVSSMRFKCVFFSRKHPQKIGGIIIRGGGGVLDPCLGISIDFGYIYRNVILLNSKSKRNDFFNYCIMKKLILF